MIAPLLYSFQQAREDLAAFTEGLTPDQLWARPFGGNPVGREIRHIGGSVDRLITYAEGRQLTDRQLRELSSEFDPGAGREELLRELEERLARAEAVVRSLDRKTLTAPREVGRKRLPTTVMGLLVHIAEHTQRHVGQAISAAKLVLAAERGSASRADPPEQDQNPA
ncbi:MAG: DinB family protein [Acidobacteriota bacterium]